MDFPHVAGAAIDGAAIDGAAIGLVWVMPFVGLLLSLAGLPLVAPRFWHHHFGKVAAFWALAFIAPFAAIHGAATTGGAIAHILIDDFLPFAILLTALFTICGGIRLTGGVHGTPGVNTLMLAIGTAVASIMGTTGAAMLIVRPLIRANRLRRPNSHVFVFLIFLVANVGGALTPLGDPPLLIGFLQGVPFFWPTRHLLLPTLTTATLLLIVFYGVDRRLHRRGVVDDPSPLVEIERLGVDGKVNLVLLGFVPVTVFLSGLERSTLATVAGNAALIGLALASLWLTRRETRMANDFSWGPMAEVVKIFAAIFITIIPAIAMLKAGPAGPLASLVALVEHHGRPVDAAYFWLTGGLSSLLDNAPTYLMFFNLAGGDATSLTGPLSSTLAAISFGAVVMGANTYIGNAPNFMVRAVCEERGIAMPSFFGYMLWAAAVLLPIYALLTLAFFR